MPKLTLATNVGGVGNGAHQKELSHAKRQGAVLGMEWHEQPHCFTESFPMYI